MRYAFDTTVANIWESCLRRSTNADAPQADSDGVTQDHGRLFKHDAGNEKDYGEDQEK